MDIERELEILIDKHKGKRVGLGEIRLDLFAEDCLKEIRRLKAEIARQSVKSEEVAEAIEDLTTLSKMWKEIGQPTKEIDLAITALQAYQPTTRKNRTVDEVAISKTETTSAKKIVVDIQLRPILDELEVDIDDIKAYISKLD